MAEIHVLTGDADGNVSVAMHFAVPNQNNSVGVNYRTALVNSQIGGSTAMVEGAGPGQITTAEKAQIEAGERYEYPIAFPVASGGLAPAKIRAALRSLYTARKIAVLAALQGRLRWFGHTESEA